MIKQLTCRNAESPHLSNQAVSCRNARMNQTHCFHSWDGASGLVALTATDALGRWWTVVLDGEELGQIADLVVYGGWQRHGGGFGLEELRAVVVLVTGRDPGPPLEYR
jgi:hypothetical protein